MRYKLYVAPLRSVGDEMTPVSAQRRRHSEEILTVTLCWLTDPLCVVGLPSGHEELGAWARSERARAVVSTGWSRELSEI